MKVRIIAIVFFHLFIFALLKLGYCAEPLIIKKWEAKENPNCATTYLIHWATNEPATSEVYNYLEPNQKDSFVRISKELTNEHDILLLGLQPKTESSQPTYHFTIKSRDKKGKVAEVSGSFETITVSSTTPPSAERPFSLPPIKLNVYDSKKAYNGWTLFDSYPFIETVLDPHALGASFIVDMEGNVLWYSINAGDTEMLDNTNLFRYGGIWVGEFNLKGDGVFGMTLSDDTQHDLLLSDKVSGLSGSGGIKDTKKTRFKSAPTGHKLKMPDARGDIHHDADIIADSQDPRGHIVVLRRCFKEIEGYNIEGALVEEWSKDNKLIWSWNVFDHMDQIPILDVGWIAKFTGGDWLHCNAVTLDKKQGFCYLSSRNLNSVFKIRYNPGSPNDGEVIYGFGTYLNQFKLLNGEWFRGQHDPEIQPNGNILIFDNHSGFPKMDPYFSGSILVQNARAVEYKINEEDMTAEQVWEFKGAPRYPTFIAPGLGDADRLPNGNTLIDASADFTQKEAKTFLMEVTPDREKVWELELPGWVTYKSQRISPLFIPNNCLGLVTLDSGLQQFKIYDIPKVSGGDIYSPVASDQEIFPDKTIQFMATGDFDGDLESELAFILTDVYQNQKLVISEATDKLEGDIEPSMYNYPLDAELLANFVIKSITAINFDDDKKDEIAFVLEDKLNKDQIVVIYDISTDEEEGVYSLVEILRTKIILGKKEKVQAVVSGDFDGDNKDEVAALIEYCNIQKLKIYEISPFNKFLLKTIIDKVGEIGACSEVIHMAAGDFDNDQVDELCFMKSSAIPKLDIDSTVQLKPSTAIHKAEGGFKAGQQTGISEEEAVSKQITVYEVPDRYQKTMDSFFVARYNIRYYRDIEPSEVIALGVIKQFPRAK